MVKLRAIPDQPICVMILTMYDSSRTLLLQRLQHVYVEGVCVACC